MNIETLDINGTSQDEATPRWDRVEFLSWATDLWEKHPGMPHQLEAGFPFKMIPTGSLRYVYFIAEESDGLDTLYRMPVEDYNDE